MARPLSVKKRLKDIVDRISALLGDNSPREGKTPVPGSWLSKITQQGRVTAERPTRDFDAFAYVQDVLANMPAATAAIRQLAEDVALDENGDSRAWTLSIKADPIDDSEGSKKKLKEFKDLAQRVFTDYALRTGIGYNAKHYVFKMLSAGDCFAEQIITLDSSTGLGRIEKIKELPTWQMRVIEDDSGNVTAYEQWLQKGFSQNNVRWQIPAQIIHLAYNPCDYLAYGQTVFAHLRGRWEQFKLIELDLISAIHTRATDPEIHLLGRKDSYDIITDEKLQKYRQELLDNPNDIQRFYVGRQGEIEYVFPKTGSSDAVTALLNAHRDLENRFVEAIVPGQVKSNAFDVARRAVSNSFDQKYARKVQSIRQDFSNCIYPSILLEFALHGIDISKPEQYGATSITLEIGWPDLGETHSQRSARVIGEYSVGLISHAESLRQLGSNDPEGEIEVINREHENGDYPLTYSQGLTPNSSQGKGVAKSESDPQANSPLLPLAMSILGDNLRELIQQEVARALNDNT